MSGRSERLFLYLRPDAREPESISGRNISTVMRVPDDESPEALLPLQPAAFHILVALAETDRHGYAIMQEVAERTGGTIRINPGTLYTTIRRLLDQGLLLELDDRPDPSEDDERRRYYRLTPFGRAVARAEVARLERMTALARRAGITPKRA
jgi:DNA-binding PadR family transcriptional regulator